MGGVKDSATVEIALEFTEMTVKTDRSEPLKIDQKPKELNKVQLYVRMPDSYCSNFLA